MNIKNNLYNWILNHDNSKLFIFLYIGLSVFLTIFISLFWLVAVVSAHFIFEIIRNRHNGENWVNTIKESADELRLDFVLVLFALWLAIYIDMIFGIAGMGAGARGVAQLGARLAGWQRVMRGVLLSVDDVFQVIKSVARYKKGVKKQAEVKVKTEKKAVVEEKHIEPKRKVNYGKIILNIVGILILGSLLLSPILSDKTLSEIFTILGQDLHPFPK